MPIINIRRRDKQAFCLLIDNEDDGRPWYHDIKQYLLKGKYPEGLNDNGRKTIRRRAMNFFLVGDILYKRNFDSILLRCVDQSLVQYSGIPKAMRNIILRKREQPSRHDRPFVRSSFGEWRQMATPLGKLRESIPFSDKEDSLTRETKCEQQRCLRLERLNKKVSNCQRFGVPFTGTTPLPTPLRLSGAIVGKTDVSFGR
ncbi:hypothetical protein Fmac_032951 [Flemingia macrophylla]|uniref:Uncharacterized protein n=1 Tax=Flemingia macrophylla TaxID=520843 RepID=A0ABD1L6D5_9FABA